MGDRVDRLTVERTENQELIKELRTDLAEKTVQFDDLQRERVKVDAQYAYDMRKLKTEFTFEKSDLKLQLKDVEFEKIALQNSLLKTETNLIEKTKEAKELGKQLSKVNKAVAK